MLSDRLMMTVNCLLLPSRLSTKISIINEPSLFRPRYVTRCSWRFIAFLIMPYSAHWDGAGWADAALPNTLQKTNSESASMARKKRIVTSDVCFSLREASLPCRQKTRLVCTGRPTDLRYRGSCAVSFRHRDVQYLTRR